MSQRILLRDHPQRSIALLTESHALILRHSPSSNNYTDPRCMIEFSAKNAVNLADYRPLRTSGAQGVHGTLGLINVNTDVFLCVISGAVHVATCLRVLHSPAFTDPTEVCLNRDDYDDVQHEEINSFEYRSDVVLPNGPEHGYAADPRETVPEHPCLALKKILSDGTFYYSVNFDLTNRLQDRSSEESAFDVDNLDEDFLWNSYMIDSLIKFRSRLAAQEKELLDASRILTSAIRGFVLTVTVPASASPIRAVQTTFPSALTLISRLSCRRAGTRFNARGIDDDGNVANFVETESVYWYPAGLCFSYAQIRGSVPLFWEQSTGILPGQQKIQITRSPEATQPAFDKHFEGLEMNYGSVHILNLLSESKPGEIELTERYKYHTKHSALNQGLEHESAINRGVLRESHFDFHAETKGPSGYEAASTVRRLIQDRAEGFAYYLSNEMASAVAISPNQKYSQSRPAVVLQQEGVFRTNCLDCLDRTNLIQTIISQMALEFFLVHRAERANADFWMRHSSLWADNGDALSRIYAGTGALKSSFTRHNKMSLAGAIADARKSATRMYINNFADKGRQNTIDTLLGRLVDQSPVHLYDPINDYVNSELSRRVEEYSTAEVVQIWVGTFNLNGRGNGTKEDLSAWLYPEINKTQQTPEIIAVGFQEIVELSPQQIMSTDLARRQEWERAVAQALNDGAKRRSSEEYILLRSGQLVGAALMIFVKANALRNIKNVEGSVKKTGLSGMAGNKGAVAIRMDYANTRICFVTAHLAAGFANYEERNRDYRTINHGLRFQRNRSIEDHDTIIWLGDFNYRIGLSDDKVRQLIRAGDLETLYQNDQLNLQMVSGLTFPFYSESRITFMPTYKYNNGTDDYDTSEKSRIPAWCDRVLRKGDNLRQINYATAPLRFSDHRPVFATFQCTISNVNWLVKDTLSREIYAQRRLEVGDITANARDNDNEDEDLIGYDSIAPGLPPASSGSRKWWLDNGLPARSSIEETNRGRIPNRRKPSNPFTPSSEADWVVLPNPSSCQSPANETTMNSATKATPAVNSRHLPPLYQPERQPRASLSHQNGELSFLDWSTKPRTPSLASSSASSSSGARKPAPPVPKKPALLTSLSDRNMNISTDEAGGPNQGSHIARSGWKTPSSGTDPSFIPHPPRRTVETTNIGQSRQRAPFDQDNGPPLPPRKPEAGTARLKDLIDSKDIGGDARGIPPLQPLSRN